MLYSELFANCAWNVPYIHKEGWVSYAFVEKDSTLYIYFQGSHEKKDWFANFFFFPTSKRPYKNMDVPYRVHRGFLKAWKIIEDTIIEKVTEQVVMSDPTVEDPEATFNENVDIVTEYKYKKIVIIGYSHGGALAGLCHECVWFHRPDLRDWGLIGYGFEAPRFYAGWKVKKELQERWNNFFVFNDGTDLVTRCPPAIFGFCHVGDILNIRGDIELVKDRVPRCLKYHYPQVVYDGLLKFEKMPEDKTDGKK